MSKHLTKIIGDTAIYTLLFFLGFPGAFAQHNYDDQIKLSSLIKQAKIIIKGERITRVPEYFYLNDSTRIFNSVQIEVKDVYKGSLKNGDLIEYITEGGILDNREYYPDHNGGITGTKDYILILEPSEIPNKYKSSQLVFTPYKPGYGEIMLTETTFAALYKDLKFKTRNELYAFLSANGLHIPHDEKDPKNTMDPYSYRKKYESEKSGVKPGRVEIGNGKKN